jgi:hypothetical protein
MEDKIENYRGCYEYGSEEICSFAGLCLMVIGGLFMLADEFIGGMMFSFGFWVFLYSIAMMCFREICMVFPHKIKSRKIRVICKICLFIFLPLTIIYIGLWAIYIIIKFIISAMWKCLTE